MERQHELEATNDNSASFIATLFSWLEKLQTAAQRTIAVLLVSLSISLLLAIPSLTYLWMQGGFWPWIAVPLALIIATVTIVTFGFWYILRSIIDLPNCLKDLKNHAEALTAKYSPEERAKLSENTKSKRGLLKAGLHLGTSLNTLRKIISFARNNISSVNNAKSLVWVTNPFFWTLMLITKVTLYITAATSTIIALLVLLFS